jgi:O-antigen ligase
VLIFIFPIVINSLQVAGDIVLFILAMMGLFIAISQRLSPFIIKEIKVFSYLTFGYFTAVCLSVLFSGQVAELAHYIPRDFSFFFAPFIVLSLYKAEINISYLLAGVKVGLIVLGLIVIYQLFSGYPLHRRPTGIMNPNVFGNLSVALFFIALVFIQHESLKNKILTFLALLSGFFIIIVSGSRGALLSFAMLSGVYLYFFYKQKTKLNSILKIITAIIIIIVVVSFCILYQPLKDRVFSTYTNTSDWIANGVSYEEGATVTSSGLRLEMYKTAIQKIEGVPFFGHGYRTSNIVVFQNSKSSAGKMSYGYNHLHNAYLTNYFNGGVVLLGALFLVLFVPLIIFIKANIQNRENPVFIAGALLTLGYASFGMVNILLGDTYMNGFYTFFLAIFMLLYAQRAKISST